MGTRADFYVGRGPDAEWLGSIAWDGYPDRGDIKQMLLTSLTEQEWREKVSSFLAENDDATMPEHGWPWPWEDSNTTDYAYTFEGSETWFCCFGSPWYKGSQQPMYCGEMATPESDVWEHDPERPKPMGEKSVFPDMTDRQRVAGGKRSGTIVVGLRGN